MFKLSTSYFAISENNVDFKAARPIEGAMAPIDLEIGETTTCYDEDDPSEKQFLVLRVEDDLF